MLCSLLMLLCSAHCTNCWFAGRLAKGKKTGSALVPRYNNNIRTENLPHTHTHTCGHLRIICPQSCSDRTRTIQLFPCFSVARATHISTFGLSCENHLEMAMRKCSGFECVSVFLLFAFHFCHRFFFFLLLSVSLNRPEWMCECAFACASTDANLSMTQSVAITLAHFAQSFIFD